jgi:hypothetical protein
MNKSPVERQKLIEAVNTLPSEVLPELAGFLDYLHYKSAQQPQPAPQPSDFLMAIAGLGSSNQQDIAERDEEILRDEIHPVYGWNLKSDQPA